MWQLAGSTASLVTANLSLSLSLANAPSGVVIHLPKNDDSVNDDSVGESQPLVRLWQLPTLQHPTLTESYVRNNDLVATYDPSDRFPFHTELCWTIRTLDMTPAPLVALSLLVSVRTDLLDTHPVIETATAVTSGSLQAGTSVNGDPMFWGQLPSGLTLVDFSPREDSSVQELTTSQAGEQTVSRQLFSHFLEKGVIRRARLFAALAPAQLSLEQARAICQEFQRIELPLTT